MGNLKIQRANPKLYNAIQQKIEEAERELAEQESGKTMTTKELAEVLGVDTRTIQLAVKRLDLARVLS